MRNALIRTSVLSFALVVVACGGGGAATQRPSIAAPATTRPATVAPATIAPQTPATSVGAGGETVMLATSALGEILVDGAGRTLYGFTPDVDAGGEITCYGGCADNWPPLEAPDEITVGEGLDDSDFSAAPRTDDLGDQVKIGDLPLYYFAGDTAPGQTNGQNVGPGKWFVVGADGELIKDAGASPTM